MTHGHVDYPAYLELGLKDGSVSSVNGKEFNKEGVVNVIKYVCKDENVDTDAVLSKIRSLKQNNGAVTLKLYDGAVTAI